MVTDVWANATVAKITVKRIAQAGEKRFIAAPSSSVSELEVYSEKSACQL
jgi:hypothetical protein